MLAKRGRRCDPAKETLWRGMLKKQQNSGLSVRALAQPSQGSFRRLV
jgi:hypothetical protein